MNEVGGAKRDRTADLYNAIVALSQLSYSPPFSFALAFPPSGHCLSQPHGPGQVKNKTPNRIIEPVPICAGDTSRLAGALLVLFRYPLKDVLFPVEVVADHPCPVVGIRVDFVIVTIEFYVALART